MWETGYITVLQVRLGAKIGDRHAKDFNAFRKRLILLQSTVYDLSFAKQTGIFGMQIPKFCTKPYL